MIDDAIRMTVEAETTEQLWQKIEAFISELGYTHACYHFAPLGLVTGQGDTPPLTLNISGDWGALETERKDLVDGIVFRRAFIRSEPFLWSGLVDAPWITTTQKHALRTVLDVVGDALTVPVFGPHVQHGFFSLSDSEIQMPQGHQLRRYQMVFQIFHSRRCELNNEESKLDAKLSSREREVIKWVARGKSNAEIAAIIGISVNTIDTHLRRIFFKLGVNDRVTAALLATSSGLVR